MTRVALAPGQAVEMVTIASQELDSCSSLDRTATAVTAVFLNTFQEQQMVSCPVSVFTEELQQLSLAGRSSEIFLAGDEFELFNRHMEGLTAFYFASVQGTFLLVTGKPSNFRTFQTLPRSSIAASKTFAKTCSCVPYSTDHVVDQEVAVQEGSFETYHWQVLLKEGIKHA